LNAKPATAVLLAAALLVLAPAGPGGAQSAGSVAREASFYAQVQFGAALAGDELKAALDRFASRAAGDLHARAIRPPRLCAERFEHVAGKPVRVILSPPQPPADVYYFAISGVDFAGLRHEGNGRIRIDWYECPRGLSYSLHSDASGAHFLLKEAGEPMLAWSRE
jgi:hypothetical protein